jgi:hypothetical protein
MVGHRTAYHCGHNPYLIARLARKVRLDAARKVAKLEWQEPDRFELSTSGPAKKIGGGSMASAPVRLVFHRAGLYRRGTKQAGSMSAIPFDMRGFSLEGFAKAIQEVPAKRRKQRPKS